MIVKMKISNALQFIKNEAAKANYEDQLRELVVNSIEAIQERMKTDPSPGHIEVGRTGEEVDGYKKTWKMHVLDNGIGISEKCASINMLTVISSGKTLGKGFNLGSGARIKTYGFNQIGVRYITRAIGSTYYYYFELVSEEGKNGEEEYGFRILSPDADFRDQTFRRVRHGYYAGDAVFHKYGTKVVLLGNEDEENTLIHPEEPNNSYWIPQYLNSRFLTIPKDITLRLKLPIQGITGKYKKIIYGAMHYLKSDLAKKNDPIMVNNDITTPTGFKTLSDGTTVQWGFNGTKKISKYEEKNRGWFDEHTRRGFIGVAYQNELYYRYPSKVDQGLYMEAGITDNFSNIWIIFYPVEKKVAASFDRNTLTFNNKVVNRGTVRKWMNEFRNILPEEIKKISSSDNLIKRFLKDRQKDNRLYARSIFNIVKTPILKKDKDGGIEAIEVDGDDKTKKPGGGGGSGGGGTKKRKVTEFEKKAGGTNKTSEKDRKFSEPEIIWDENNQVEEHQVGIYNYTTNVMLVNKDHEVFSMVKDRNTEFQKEISDAALVRVADQSFISFIVGNTHNKIASKSKVEEIESALSSQAITSYSYGVLPILIERTKQFSKIMQKRGKK